MANKLLVVDDDLNLLASHKRILRGQWQTDTAAGGKEGLRLIEKGPTYAAVVSDFRMPEMDGIAFLAKVKEISPDTVRLMLTGHADLETTVRAVNESNIFRLLIKPSTEAELKAALTDAVREHELIMAERVLLEQTLSGSLRVFGDMLAVLMPQEYGLLLRLLPLLRRIARKMGYGDYWELETAALLSLLDHLTSGQNKELRGPSGPAGARDQSFSAVEVIRQIPRLDNVARIIAYRDKGYDGSGWPTDQLQGDDLPLGSRILKAVSDFELLTNDGYTPGSAIDRMKRDQDWYDPQILEILVLEFTRHLEIKEVGVFELRPGMTLVDDIHTLSVAKNRKILQRGQELSPATINLIKRWHKTVGINQPIRVIEEI